jgi:hypothetical protein
MSVSDYLLAEIRSLADKFLACLRGVAFGKRYSQQPNR